MGAGEGGLSPSPAARHSESRGRAGPGAVPVAPDDPPQIAPVDWPAFLHLARSHRVLGLITRALAQCRRNIPPEIILELQAAHQASALQTLFLVSRLLQLIKLLEDHGIAVIPFKGPILAQEIFGDVALRSVGDLDLLVRRENILAARQLLVDRGYTPVFPRRVKREEAYLQSLRGNRLDRYIRDHAEHHLASADGKVAVDLHWGIALKEFALPLDMDRFWQNVRPSSLAGQAVRTMGVEDLLMVLCINGAKDCWPRLDRICDVAGVVAKYPQLDWRRLISDSRDGGIARIVAVTLSLARDLLHIPLPRDISDWIDGDMEAAQIASEIRPRLCLAAPEDDDAPGDLSRFTFQLRLRDRLPDRLRFVAAQFSPTVGDWAACPLPDQLRFLHYVIRPIRLMLNCSS